LPSKAKFAIDNQKEKERNVYLGKGQLMQL